MAEATVDPGHVEIYDVFEQAVPAPGYKPMRCEVRAVADFGWALVRYAHSPTLRPVQVASLLNPKLWRLVGSTAVPDPEGEPDGTT